MNKKIPSEECEICGDIGNKDSIITCFNCRDVKEHIYCARIRLWSVPDMWICEACRSSARVLHISNLVKTDNNVVVEYCGLRPEIDMPITSNGGSILSELLSMPHSSPIDKGKKEVSLVLNDKKQRPRFVAFPSPKRRRRTFRPPGVM